MVVKRSGDLPVYTVNPENRDGPLRTLHRDLLLPCRFLPITEPEEPVTPKLPRRPQTRHHPGTRSSSSQEDYINSNCDYDTPMHRNVQVEHSKFTRVYNRNQSKQPLQETNVKETHKPI